MLYAKILTLQIQLLFRYSRYSLWLGQTGAKSISRPYAERLNHYVEGYFTDVCVEVEDVSHLLDYLYRNKIPTANFPGHTFQWSKQYHCQIKQEVRNARWRLNNIITYISAHNSNTISTTTTLSVLENTEEQVGLSVPRDQQGIRGALPCKHR